MQCTVLSDDDRIDVLYGEAAPAVEDRVRALKGQFVVENLEGCGVRVRAFLPKARELEVA